ncbi:FkbM family methyltransferase [Ilumatobacter sp.]|uniref:FkbM family methyltransferase n=1 Tax=Ilumatobacter sp. TaxID=1967498 RepID=UPI003AF50951
MRREELTEPVREFVRVRPHLYDRIRRAKRLIPGASPESFGVLDEFSRAHDRSVNFVQIGANDGLRNDPLRPLIVRDDWQGVLVEPLPTVIPLLERNYAYLRRPELVLLNAAAVAAPAPNLEFWTFSEEFLGMQSPSDRLDYLRKASFERDHLIGFVPSDRDPDQVLVSIEVDTVPLTQIVQEHLPRAPLHLLAIDAEGFESTLIPGIDFGQVDVEAVFFESEHLGADRARVLEHLSGHGFALRQVGLDTLASR